MANGSAQGSRKASGGTASNAGSDRSARTGAKGNGTDPAANPKKPSSALWKQPIVYSDSDDASDRSVKRKHTRRTAAAELYGSDEDSEYHLGVPEDLRKTMLEASKNYVQLGHDLRGFHAQWVYFATDAAGCAPFTHDLVFVDASLCPSLLALPLLYRMKDLQLMVLDREQDLFELTTHPDYIHRMEMIETKNARKVQARDARFGYEKHRIESMSKVEREGTLRWFMEKKHLVRKEVRAEIMGQADVVRLEHKALKQMETGWCQRVTPRTRCMLNLLSFLACTISCNEHQAVGMGHPRRRWQRRARRLGHV